MRWLLVTGAGASCALGLDRPLPLMKDWSRLLHKRLEEIEPNLGNAAGIGADISGELFEEALGALLRWQDMRNLNRQFLGLGGVPIGAREPQIERTIEIEDRRLELIMQALNHTLYEEFSAPRIDEAVATEAYGALLEQLNDLDQLTVVTTNYDPSVEIALARLGWEPETGFERRPGKEPILRPDGLVRRQSVIQRGVPVIHLHGAVGWYERDGAVFERPQNQPFDPRLGRPVVLYPDPNKDPTRDAVVQGLWREFDSALVEANRILVLGHSLHDAALVQRLQFAAETKVVGVTTRATTSPNSGARPEGNPAEVQRILDLFSTGPNFPSGGANVLPVEFGPSSERDLQELNVWRISNP